MALQRLLHEGQCGSFFTGFRDKAFKDFTFVIDGAPQVMHLAVDLHVDLIEMPSPMSHALHPANPLPSDFPCEHRAKAVPPEPDSFMTKINAALEQQIFYIPQR